MAEYAAVPSYMKLDMLRISIKERGLIPRDSYFKVVQRCTCHTLFFFGFYIMS